MMIFVAGLGAAIRTSLRWRQAEERLIEAERQKTEAELKNLKKHTQTKYQHGIAQNILTHFVREHIAGNQTQVIDIEDNKIAQRNTTMPQELGQIEAASTVHEYKRKAKNEQPTDNMDTHFQKTSL